MALLSSSPARSAHAIILNMWARGKLGSTEACAFIRHAFCAFYADFTLVETDGRTFTPVLTFGRTVRSFGQGINAGRKYTSRKQHLARADRERFPGIISIDETTYDFALTSAFTDAIDGAARDADAHHARHTPNAM